MLLWQHRLYAEMSKCASGAGCVEYLGHSILANGVSTDPSKIETIKQWPTPSFLGFTSYCRRFVRGYGAINQPLVDLLKKRFLPKVNSGYYSFRVVKESLDYNTYLSLAKLFLPFEVEIDASDYCIGAVLSQLVHPIIYISKSLSPKHRGPSAYEMELFAILFAVKKWGHYIQCKPFVIKTNHQNLKQLLE